MTIRTRTFSSLLCVSALLLLAPVAVQAKVNAPEVNRDSDLQHLLEIIQQQQQRLDAQDAQIQEQQQLLLDLRRRVETAQGIDTLPAQMPENAVVGKADTTSPPLPVPSKSDADDPAEQWPGSIGLPGTAARLKLSGFVELDVIRDSTYIPTPSAFVTQAIPTRKPTTGSRDGQTNFSIQASRFVLESQTPLQSSSFGGSQQINTLFAWDLFNDFSSTTPEFRLRQAYGEVKNFLNWKGDILFGQDWSTFTNGYAVPDTLEFQAPNALFGSRHPMIRWTMPFADELTAKFALEAPDLRNFEKAETTIESSDPTISIQTESRWPDGVAALHLDREPFHISGAFLARDLRASNDYGDDASAFGWGATLQGRISMMEPLKDDFLQFSLAYGEGIGGLFNDVPPDAVYDVENNDLEPLETLGWFVAYNHQWSPQVYSLATYSFLEQDNENVQADTGYHQTIYSSINLVWMPTLHWRIGIETVYGRREDKDGESGSNVRTLLTSRFIF